jgi:hypothetical protein
MLRRILDDALTARAGSTDPARGPAQRLPRRARRPVDRRDPHPPNTPATHRAQRPTHMPAPAPVHEHAVTCDGRRFLIRRRPLDGTPRVKSRPKPGEARPPCHMGDAFSLSMPSVLQTAEPTRPGVAARTDEERMRPVTHEGTRRSLTAGVGLRGVTVDNQICAGPGAVGVEELPLASDPVQPQVSAGRSGRADRRVGRVSQ